MGSRASVSTATEEDRTMGHACRAFSRTLLTGIFVVGLLVTARTSPADANAVLTWNETALKAVAAGGQNPVQISRTLAMVQGAVHDALNAITRRYAAYYFEGPGDAGASPEAAVAAAAHTVLVGVLPSVGTPAQKVAALAIAEDAYLASLSHGGDGVAKTKGVAVGRAAGAAMLALRKDDGATKDAPYTPGTGPGKWRPHPNPDPPDPPVATKELAPGYGPALLPGWGAVTPFTLLSASQFWLPGPPALASEAYARDYNEVKRLGGRENSARTAEQTEIARFWFEGIPAWSRIARVVATARGLDAWDSARLLALMHLAMADAYIEGFKVRYAYDFWRPVTAIHEGDTDGNDATAGDPRWNSLQNTPAIPDYPSTMSLISGAAAPVLAGVLGTDQVSFSVTSGPPFKDITRAYTSFSQAARESADSRVYAGIHFRSACEDGLVLGRQIGERAVAMYLQPVKQ
jgi:PAP2 superfamily/Vanadium chloroperoxidase N-terminal domain